MWRRIGHQDWYVRRRSSCSGIVDRFFWFYILSGCFQRRFPGLAVCVQRPTYSKELRFVRYIPVLGSVRTAVEANFEKPSMRLLEKGIADVPHDPDLPVVAFGSGIENKIGADIVEH